MGTNSGTGGDFDASFTEDTDVPSAWLDPTPSLTHDGYKLVVTKHNPNLDDTQVRLEHVRNRYGNEHLRREYGRLFRGNRKCHRLRVDEYHGKWDDKNDRTGVCV